MSSIIKLTIAEFKKVFKRPSIFIMAIILVATILASMFIFVPETRNNETITYTNAETSIDYYSNFYDETVISSKASFDKYFADDASEENETSVNISRDNSQYFATRLSMMSNMMMQSCSL